MFSLSVILCLSVPLNHLWPWKSTKFPSYFQKRAASTRCLLSMRSKRPRCWRKDRSSSWITTNTSCRAFIRPARVLIPQILCRRWTLRTVLAFQGKLPLRESILVLCKSSWCQMGKIRQQNSQDSCQYHINKYMNIKFNVFITYIGM